MEISPFTLKQCCFEKRIMELTVVVFTYICLKELPMSAGLISPDNKQFSLTGASNLNKLPVDFYDSDLRSIDTKAAGVNEVGPQSNNIHYPSDSKFEPQEEVPKVDVVGNGRFERPFPEMVLPRRHGQKLVSLLTPPKPLEPHHVLLKEIYKLARNIHKNVTRDKTAAAHSADPILLESGNNFTQENLVGIKTGSKAAESEVSRGIAMFATIFCQHCKDQDDTECMKRHCSAE